MTWNVWWRFGGAWREREPAVLGVLADARPDVLALVETWRDADGTQADLVAERLGLPAAVFVPTGLPPVPDAPEPDLAGVEMGIALVARWPPLATRNVPLPATQRPGPPAHVLHATLDHPAGPLHVLVATLEWEPRYAEDRMAQAWALADLAADAELDGDLPVLVLGDLNARPDGPQMAALTRQLADLWPLGGGDPAAATLSSVVPEAPLEVVELIDQRIDHVLARPGRPGGTLRADGARLAGTAPVGGRYPSDHFAVVVDVELTS
ncbi:endonuclease/exonuclease/phosphatase family protein [Cellulomonas sp. PS-H5]|uniref:endonuclease/exonuclease/phosphatase family protein n=1 Tax=Cellulomonas sp. PS-H5 TaxID=2820400 RepID=UPI002103DBC6|nr:endonuclease/exonuclease/phosphatase family protein [Cellulomonas sp. PS-H5]